MPKDYNSFTDVATGDVYSAASHNLILENINNYRVPPMCKARRTTTQSIPNGAATSIQLNATDAFDTDTMHDTVTSDTRITVNTAGIYLVQGNLSFVTSATGSYRLIGINKNGVELVSANFGAGTDKRCSIAYVDAAASASDYYELWAYQDSGGALNVTPLGNAIELSVVWLGQVS